MKGKIYFLDLNRDFATAAVVLVGILEASHAELFYEIYWAKVVSGMVQKGLALVNAPCLPNFHQPKNVIF